MSSQQSGPPAPNADQKFNELRHSFRHVIPRHMRNVRDSVRHIQSLRRGK